MDNFFWIDKGYSDMQQIVIVEIAKIQSNYMQDMLQIFNRFRIIA